MNKLGLRVHVTYRGEYSEDLGMSGIGDEAVEGDLLRGDLWRRHKQSHLGDLRRATPQSLTKLMELSTRRSVDTNT